MAASGPGRLVCSSCGSAYPLEAVAGHDGNTAYVGAKHALAQAVRRRAPEWGALGIRLNAVAPGKMETPMLDALLGDVTPTPLDRAIRETYDIFTRSIPTA